MEILVYDLESYQNDIYDIVSEHLNIKFIKVFNKEDFFFLHNQRSENITIIDVTETSGEEIFNLITNKNKKQKVLAISKTISYNQEFSCEECAKIYNRKLLLKPLNVGQLIAYIQNFDNLICKFSSNLNNILEIMADIVEQFLYYSYDEENRMIIKKETQSKDIKELIKITELLKTHNIQFSIVDENIKLHF